VGRRRPDEFGRTFWTVNLDNGLRMLKQAIHSHIITAHYAVPLMLGRGRGIIFEITDGDAFYYRGNLFYDLVKISVIRLAFAMARELRKRDVVSVALTPGFLRSERVLEHFGVSEANWKEAGNKNVSPENSDQNSADQNDAPADFMMSESPRYIGRAVVALAADPKVENEERTCLQFLGTGPRVWIYRSDGTRPDWGNYARKKYGKYKICDEQFYSYWVPAW